MITAEYYPSEPEASPPGVVGASSILVVDDSESNRDVLSRCLRQQGYTVATAADGSRALELIARGGFELVLLDIIMPGLSGLNVLQTLRQQYSAADLPIIMATGMDQSEDIVQALELGANDYVTKPLDLAVVLARVQTQLSLKRSVQQIRDLEERLHRRNGELELANARLKASNGQLAKAHDHLRRDLAAAARIQEAFLPSPTTQLPGMHFAWAFRPCEQLAGDSLNVCALDGDHVGFYVLDVSGHGVAAALLAVTVTHTLWAGGHAASLLRDGEAPHDQRVLTPAEVIQRLNQQFPCDPKTGQFFTIVYGVMNVKSRELRYASAGHPPGIHLGKTAGPVFLDGAALPIGLGGSGHEHVLRLNPGDRLYFYTDGLTERVTSDGRNFGSERLLQAVERGRPRALPESISLLLDGLPQWNGSGPLRDDVSVLALEAAE